MRDEGGGAPSRSGQGGTGIGRAAAPDDSGAAAGHVRLVRAPDGNDVAALVRTEGARARDERRDLLVYVGASWCEPCQRFHRAAESGDLDTTFPTLTLLEFDNDHDAERLVSAGYTSRLIPLFALPGPDGRASGKQIEGGIKGDGAVGYITPRLKALLSQR
jgi:thiol-disulfide isomerase/thioredoxin